MNRRAFLAALVAPFVARFLPKPTTGSLFNPHANLAKIFKARLPVGDTIRVKTPLRYIVRDPRVFEVQREYNQLLSIRADQLVLRRYDDAFNLTPPPAASSTPSA